MNKMMKNLVIFLIVAIFAASIEVNAQVPGAIVNPSANMVKPSANSNGVMKNNKGSSSAAMGSKTGGGIRGSETTTLNGLTNGKTMDGSLSYSDAVPVNNNNNQMNNNQAMMMNTDGGIPVDNKQFVYDNIVDNQQQFETFNNQQQKQYTIPESNSNNNQQQNEYSNTTAFTAGALSSVAMAGVAVFVNKKVQNKRGSKTMKSKATLSGKADLKEPLMAKWLPKSFGVKAPEYLDGRLAGDVGFDPLGFGLKQDIDFMRDAELKHARIAMLAAAGWPASEILNKELAEALNEPTTLGDNGMVPSILNGYGQNPEWLIGAYVMAVAIGSYFERMDKVVDPSNRGDKDWDPLNLKEKNLGGRTQFEMETAELKHGRLAMLAITSFVFEELVAKIPVINDNPVEVAEKFVEIEKLKL